jgi:lipid-binding SYLF domain-containing protein
LSSTPGAIAAQASNQGQTYTESNVPETAQAQPQTAPDPQTQTSPSTTGKAGKHAKGKAKADTKNSHTERIAKATAVVNEMAASTDRRIPDSLLRRAEAIAVIPGMVKGALGVGGTEGKGLVSQRTANGWSQPAFIEIGGGSFGAQLGVSSTDLVLVFTDKAALQNLEKGHDLKLGADAAIVAGPVGRAAEAGTDANLKSGIYAYSRAKGLFAGVALDGAVLKMDEHANTEVYGANVTPEQIWMADPTTANPTVRPFMDALQRMSPAKKITQLQN